MTQVAAIGHNNPPEATPFDIARDEIAALREEAGHWMDGAAVSSQSEADAIGKLLDMARKAVKHADDARKDEKKPHDDAGKAVQAKYKPVLDTGNRIVDACKAALAPWLEKIDAEKRAEEQRLREEAEAARGEAEEALRAADVTNLEARESAEQLLAAAKDIEGVAKRAEKDKARATGGARAVSLRTYYHPELVNGTEAARHYWQTSRETVEDFLISLAEKDIAKGKRSIPGFNIVEERKAV